MKKNIGSTDRMIRIILGFVILIIGIVAKSWWGLVGLIPVVTALIGWCPAYVPFGISTKSETKQEK